MDDLYRTPTRNGQRDLDIDEITQFHTPTKAIVDSHRERWREHTTPSNGLPDSNRDNVVDALRNIQDRMRNLEMERVAAEQNLRDMSAETSFYRKSLGRAKDDVERSPQRVARQQADLQSQLQSADTRCDLLDKQLDYMRKLLNEAETEKRLAVERSEQLARLRDANTDADMRSQMDKISEMERDHMRLQANQALAQDKIRDLEDRLEQQRGSRISDRAIKKSELRSAAQTNQILVDKLTPPSSPTRIPPPRAKRKKKTVRRSLPEPGVHYRLNMADIPFVVGQATTPSHRLGANVQNVIAMMKSHNPRLCAAAGNNKTSRPRSARSKGREPVSSTTESETEVGEMLDQLMDEYTHMTASHHELTRQLDKATSQRLADELDTELARLNLRLETKAEQIGNLRRHQQNMAMERHSRPRSAPSMEARKAYNVPSSSTTGEVQVTTTIKTKGRRADKVTELRPSSRQDLRGALQGMKTLKTRLKPDELQWT